MDVRLNKLPSSDHRSTIQLNSCKSAIKGSCSREPAQVQQTTLGCNELLARASCTPSFVHPERIGGGGKSSDKEVNTCRPDRVWAEV